MTNGNGYTLKRGKKQIGMMKGMALGTKTEATHVKRAIERELAKRNIKKKKPLRIVRV